MSRFLFWCLVSLGHAVVVGAHELPEDEIERRVQIIVRPDRVSVQYSLAMNQGTLEKQLRQFGREPAATFAGMWQQYQELILQALPEQVAVTVNGTTIALKPIRADHSGWSHHHLTCLLAAPIDLTESPKVVAVTDRNFLDSPGSHRIAMKALSGARMNQSTVPAIVSRAKAIPLKELSEVQRQTAVRVEGTFVHRRKGRDDAVFPSELVDFLPSKENPLFAGTGRNTWDRRIRERGCLLREGDSWHLWYTGYSGPRTATRKLGYATSRDGMKWERHPNNPVFTDTWTEDVHVVRHQGRLYMVAEGKGDIPHLLVSDDGVEWADKGRLDVRRQDGSPISPGPYGTPTLWVEDETWYLFYERRDRAIWLARSTDREIWTNVQDSPVIDRGPAEYDRYAIALNQVFRHKGRYYGVYHANGDPERRGPWTTCIAASDDLITWTKYAGNPIVRTNDSSGQLIFDGKQFRLYTMHPDVKVYFPANKGN
ncbi:MAG: hypothetical protein AAFU85_10070 [Planctomycetota bacterium]